MYSSLHSIDVVAQVVTGGRIAHLSDHRSRAELDAAGPLAILFALTRIIGARRYLEGDAPGPVTVEYVAKDEPPPALVEALAAAGAQLQVGIGGTVRDLGPALVTVEQVVGRAFVDLAAVVAARTGLTDPAGVLRVLEAEISADVPGLDVDPDAYWSRIFELMAAVVAVVKIKHDGAWTITQHSDLPFAFTLTGTEQHMLPGNRATRFLIDRGRGSMFELVLGVEESLARRDQPPGPIMPNLRGRAEVNADGKAWRALLPGDRPDAPVIIYGNDGEHTVGWKLAPQADDMLAELHREALANMVGVEVEIEQVGTDTVPVLVVSGSYFATEKLLDVAFMKGLHRRLASEVLVVGVPSRGLMFVTGVAHAGVLEKLIATQHGEAGTDAITTMMLVVVDGEVTASMTSEASDADEPEPAPRKKGFFRKLFGR